MTYRIIFAAVLLTAVTGFAQDPVTKFREGNYAIKTVTGYYLTAENGGGGPVNSDRQQRGPWETFVMSQVAPGVFRFKAIEKDVYLADATARNGRGGLTANRRQPDTNTQFRLVLVNPEGPVVALQTASGNYVTAENSGGMKGARGPRSVATNRNEIGEWELFVLERVN